MAICIDEENTFYLDQKSVLTPNTEHIFKIGFQPNFTNFKGIWQPVVDFLALYKTFICAPREGGYSGGGTVSGGGSGLSGGDCCGSGGGGDDSGRGTVGIVSLGVKTLYKTRYICFILSLL